MDPAAQNTPPEITAPPEKPEIPQPPQSPEIISPPQPPEIPPPTPVTVTSSDPPKTVKRFPFMWVTIILIIVVVAFGGSFLYFQITAAQ